MQYLADEMRLLDLLLLRQLHLRQKSAVDHTSAGGFFISKEEVISLLDHSGAAAPDCSDDPDIAAIDRLIAELKAGINDHLSSHMDDHVNFPFLRMARTFGLDDFEAGVVIMAFAFETDKKYEKIHAYFNDDMTKKMPSVSTALDVLYSDNNWKLNGRRHFSPDSPLLCFNLIHFVDDHSENSFMTRRFRLDERINRFIAGDNGLHESLVNIAGLYSPCGEMRALNPRTDVKERIIHIFMDRMKANTGRPVFWLFGKAKEEKKTVVTAVCEEVRLPVITADLDDVCLESDHRAVMKNIFREAALQSAIVFLEGGDRLYGSDEKSGSLRSSLLKTLRQLSWITFISAEILWMPDNTDVAYRWYPMEFKLPGYAERKRIWTESLNGNGSISESDIDMLSGRFNFSEGRIKNAAFYARQQASNGDKITLDHIYKACRVQSGHGLSAHAAKVDPHYKWDDIILPEDKKRHLKEISSHIKHRHLVYFTWGFEKKLALGRGLNILFSGPSGTGKTMASGIIANELCLDLYKIDLSLVVSKYIGETEKNLSRIFLAAESSSAILFFDEADALFGKRSEVKDSHDRYANIETGYLLQKMEEHEGIVILATNLRNNMDEAFVRRLHFTVEFPFPDKRQRELIWENIFPEGAPVSSDVDFGFLAEKLKLAGGNIRNIALTAAFYAAEELSDIQMRHIILSAKREYEKMGKLCVKGDFGDYYDFIEKEAKA